MAKLKEVQGCGGEVFKKSEKPFKRGILCEFVDLSNTHREKFLPGLNT